MNRRRFMGCLGCGCASAVFGCTTQRGSKQGDAMTKHELDTDALSKLGWDVSVCGLNCAKCQVLERGECAGCRGPAERHWSGDCLLRPCAEAKGHRYCFECASFPCDKLEAFAAEKYEHHRLAVENMKAMKAMGLQNWIARQPKPMFCPGD